MGRARDYLFQGCKVVHFWVCYLNAVESTENIGKYYWEYSSSILSCDLKLCILHFNENWLRATLQSNHSKTLAIIPDVQPRSQSILYIVKMNRLAFGVSWKFRLSFHHLRSNIVKFSILQISKSSKQHRSSERVRERERGNEGERVERVVMMRWN